MSAPSAPDANSAASNTTAQDTGAPAPTDTAQAVGGDYPKCKTRSQDHCRVPRSWYGEHATRKSSNDNAPS
jgi:hypothetical protein